MDSRGPPKRTVSILNSVAEISTTVPAKIGTREPRSVDFSASSGAAMSELASSLLAQEDAFLWHEVQARAIKQGDV